MSANLRPLSTSPVGFESNGRSIEPAFVCRRRNCPKTMRGRRSWCCGDCWDELSTNARRWLMRVESFLTQHPSDEQALRLRERFIELAAAEWEPLPEPVRTDEDVGEVHGRTWLPRRAAQ